MSQAVFKCFVIVLFYPYIQRPKPHDVYYLQVEYSNNNYDQIILNSL